jgi:negative regulator of sigma E activity
MTKIEKESLSALLDNEANDLELRRILKSCEQDPDLLKTWERYSLVQSVLHESAVPVSAELSQKIAAQVETEAPLVANEAPAAQPVWRQSLMKMAIAASVAAVFLVSMQIGIDNSAGPGAVPLLSNQSTDLVDSVAADDSSAPVLLAETGSSSAGLVDGGVVREYIESLTLDEEEPVRIEHIQDSPLYRLVNELQAKP